MEITIFLNCNLQNVGLIKFFKPITYCFIHCLGANIRFFKSLKNVIYQITLFPDNFR
jgi:hypothetical protein